MMLGQTEVMEYTVLIFMIMFIIFFVLIMVFGMQFISTGIEKSETMEKQSLFVLQNMLASKALGSSQQQKQSVFEDVKLTVATCEDIEELYGRGIWVNITMYRELPDCDGLAYPEFGECEDEKTAIEEMNAVECDETTYPECGYWTFCDREDRMVYRSVPVNIYRKMDNRLGIGVLTIGIRSVE